ncbi:RrF2 family transcriptional regulator [Microbacter margulisiae]|uniref:Rrf2 family protein n=1 Tax=Microbacter margulisiae TaxID=1350067 RepID=A0A7W5H287_9PORP|nr:Rrf2 family transcriptional regulator [Microbacter margulisiae]MBB3187490.1 Rrf2 family protein [Microbacter margulisiae]
MKISTRTRYGIRAMAEIAQALPGHGVYQKDIAFRQQISVKYLDSIIQALKTSNLIVNIRGKKSGYILTRAPEQITMLDIHNAFENGICIIECLSPAVRCDRVPDCKAYQFWNNLNSIIVDYFKSITLKDVIDKQIVDLDRLNFPSTSFLC